MQQKSLEIAKYMENFLKDQKNKPFKYDGKKLKPNDPCSCGSGKKYKKCCKSHKEIKTPSAYIINPKLFKNSTN